MCPNKCDNLGRSRSFAVFRHGVIECSKLGGRPAYDQAGSSKSRPVQRGRRAWKDKWQRFIARLLGSSGKETRGVTPDTVIRAIPQTRTPMRLSQYNSCFLLTSGSSPEKWIVIEPRRYSSENKTEKDRCMAVHSRIRRLQGKQTYLQCYFGCLCPRPGKKKVDDGNRRAANQGGREVLSSPARARLV